MQKFSTEFSVNRYSLNLIYCEHVLYRTQTIRSAFRYNTTNNESLKINPHEYTQPQWAEGERFERFHAAGVGADLRELLAVHLS